MKKSITVIILTFNEAIHLQRCIDSVRDIAHEILVVDSFSSDATIEIATKNGCRVVQNRWENSYAKQFNWALSNGELTSEWVLRLDADEYLSEASIAYIKNNIGSLGNGVSGICFDRRVIFLGKEIKFGGKHREWQLRLFRLGHGFCERRWMDEHIKLVDGIEIKEPVPFYDNNLNSVSWWIDKHNGYAIREAFDILNGKYRFVSLKSDELSSHLLEGQASRKRWFKRGYNRLPLFIRPFFYYGFRYFFLLGFLDGVKGGIFHFLQGFWYRFLVDVFIFEIERAGDFNKERIQDIFISKYGISLKL